jgi:hypothetical protein
MSVCECVRYQPDKAFDGMLYRVSDELLMPPRGILGVPREVT